MSFQENLRSLRPLLTRFALIAGLCLGGLFWFYPRQPRTPARRAFDIAALLVALIAFVVAIRWGHAIAEPTGTAGNIWRQVVATATGYGVFLAVMTVAWFTRRAWLRGR